MINQRLPEFNQVAAGKTSLLRIPKYDLTLKALEFRLGGTFTKAQISEIRLKLGTSVRSVISGSQLDTINQYKGLFADAFHLPLDFSERDAKDIIAEEVGGWDMAKLSDDLYIEVDVAAGAVGPTLYTMAYFTPPQGDVDPAKPQTYQQMTQKYIRVNYQANGTGGTRNQLPFDPKGAMVKRAFFNYTGTDWTTSADGNLLKAEIKKNGGVVHELGCLDNRFVQQKYRKVPQSKYYVVDFIPDNNLSGALRSADAKAMEWNLFFTAADNVTAIFDVLDKPYNL